MLPHPSYSEATRTGHNTPYIIIYCIFYILHCIAEKQQISRCMSVIVDLILTVLQFPLCFCLAASFFYQVMMMPPSYRKLDPQPPRFHTRPLGVDANTLNNWIPWFNFVLDCSDLYRQGFHTSGVYRIYPSGPFLPLSVYCDMESDGGGWTVFQRRMDGSVDFYRGWDNYKKGFGTADGLQNIHLLTARRNYELRIDMEDFENQTVHAKYKQFAVAPDSIHAEGNGYTLLVQGFTDGGAGDSLVYHNGLKFSTFDKNQEGPINCAQKNSGAFWYKSCHTVNLNGLYLRGPHASYANGIHWATWTGYYYSLKATAMKMRPTSVG
ncbi:microfibril-associated glycoprotein 4-like isoform X2 [Hypanus sabinus]|uniref:microfibril-associated glycoprotein 4-like isoform X2 n=1 Tax=Hypanus sabinus TaxID=79690 RepID=UPI0028C4D7A0|nr:microfibril-associated glycoprotein 4-like isoform X2 [Hypanus sabinus]